MNRKQHIIQVPEVKRVGVYAIHNKVTDKYYVGSSSNVITGLVGEVDGVNIIKAPASYFPEKTNFVITNPVVMPSPIKLAEYKIHDDAPGISGSLVEGRVRYDAFVLDQKKDAIGVCQNPAG